MSKPIVCDKDWDTYVARVDKRKINGIVLKRGTRVYLDIKLETLDPGALEASFGFIKSDGLEIRFSFDVCFDWTWIPKRHYLIYAEDIHQTENLYGFYSLIFAQLLTGLIFNRQTDPSIGEDVFEVEARLKNGQSLFARIYAKVLEEFLVQ